MATNNDLKWVITSKPKWVDVTPMEGQGDMQVNVTIHEDVDPSSGEEGYITVTCTSCKEQKQRQISVCRCTCNCDRLSIIWEIDTISQTGMSSNTRIGTYTINGACTEDNISARIKKNGSSGTGTALSLSNGIITTTRKISANVTPDEIKYDITVAIKNGDACGRLSHEMRQEGIVCNCNIFVADSFIVTIPRNGYPQGAEIGSYQLTDDGKHCPQSDIKATLSGSDATYELVCENEKVSLPSNKGIQGNTDPDDKHFNLVVKYNNDTCDSADIVQEGTGCGCNSFHDFTVGNIPNSGITSTTYQIGSFILDNGCSYNDYSLVEVSGSFTLSVSSDNKVYITSTIPENTATTQNNYRVELRFRGNGCGLYKDIIQPGIDCGCGNLTSVSFITIPTEGVAAQTVIGSYEVQGDCEFTFTSSTLSLSTDSNHNIITNNAIAATTDPTGETFSVDVVFNGSSCSACTVTQSGTGCGCGTLHDVTFIDIPSEGVSASENYEIGTYTTDSNVCNYTFAEVNNSFTMRGDNDTGKIIVTSDIPANTGYEPIDFTVIAKHGSDECVRSAITQEGSLKCDCESIGLMVSLRKRTFPKSGTTQWADEGHGVGWVLVATGDTYGCGSLSGISESNLLESPGVFVDDIGNNKYNFYIKMLPSSTPGDETAGLKFYFKKKHEEQYEDDCYQTLYIRQSNDYCECGNMPEIKYNSNPVTNNMEINVSQDANTLTFMTEDIYNSLECYNFEISTPIPWITLTSKKRKTSSNEYYYETLYADVEANTGANRTGYVYIERYVDRDGIPEEGEYVHGKDGLLCDVLAVKINQDAYVGCSCENSGFDNLGYTANPRKESVDACEHENMRYPFKLNCGTLTYKSKEGELPDWVTITIDNESNVMYMSIAKNEGEERDASILFYPIIDGVECDDNPFELQVVQEKLICDDCEKVKEKIITYPTVQWCLTGNEHYFGKYPDSDCLCGSISAVTCDENGNEIVNPDVIEITYPRFSNSYNPKAKFTNNNTGADRDFYFKLFVVDDNGNMVPDNNCYKIVHVCQGYNEETCDCSSYITVSLSTTGYDNTFTAGTGTHKVGKLTLTKRSEESLTDCLLVSATTTHAEIESVWVDENNEVNITVISELDDKVSHAAAVDVNIFNTNESDPDTGSPKKCTFLIQPIELTIVPNKNTSGD